MKDNEPEYVEGCRSFIEVIGTKRLCELCEVLPQHLTYWKAKGIPKSWRLFLAEKFPREWSSAFNANK
jgi:hypothetical protein